MLITIPEYFKEGLKLYSNFQDKVAEQLGESKTREIKTELEQLVRSSNADFGVREQQILIEETERGFHIVHESGSLASADKRFALAKITATSDVRSEDLGDYSYLRPLFPLAMSDRNAEQR